jgi:hypothetical protein
MHADSSSTDFARRPLTDALSSLHGTLSQHGIGGTHRQSGAAGAANTDVAMHARAIVAPARVDAIAMTTHRFTFRVFVKVNPVQARSCEGVCALPCMARKEEVRVVDL